MKSPPNHSFAWASCLLLALACGGAVETPTLSAPSEWAPVNRLIGESPDRLFDPSSLLEVTSRATFDLGEEEELAAWRAVGPARVETVKGQGVTVIGTAGLNFLVREVELAADEIDVVEVRGRSWSVVEPRLVWSSSGGGDPSGWPRLEATSREPSRLLFRVTDSPQWEGEIAAIGVVLPLGSERRLFVSSVSAGRSAVTEEAWASAVGRPWLFEIAGGEMRVARSGLLAPPGDELRWPVRVPEGGQLSVHFGVVGEGRGASFRIGLASGRTPERILAEMSWPEAAGEDGWGRISVDLAEWEGREVELRMVAAGEGAPRGTLLPVWADVEIVGRSDRPAAAVVIVSLDTLRADRMSAYGYGRPTSPGIDSWAAQDAVRFDDAVSASPWTLPSHASMFSGLSAHRHGIVGQTPAPGGLVTLAELLREAGWATVAVTGGGYLHPRYGLLQGFDEVHFWTPGDTEGEIAAGTERALRLLPERMEAATRRGRPFLLLFHSYEVHDPYRARRPYFDRWSRFAGAPESRAVVKLRPRPGGLDPGRLLATRAFHLREESGEETRLPPALDDLARDMYDSGIAHADRHVTRLLDALATQGQADRSLVVVTSDHGEMLGEHGLVGHHCLYEPNVRVPLLIAAPGIGRPGRRVADQVRGVDLTPTVLSTVGLPVPQRLDGVSLLPLLRGVGRAETPPATIYASGGQHGLALRLDDGRKLIYRDSVWPPHRGRSELFRLAVDPGEEHDLGGEDPATRRLERRARRVLAGEAGGLHLELVAGDRNPLVGILQLPGLAGALKSVDAECACLRRLGSDRVRFEVPAATTFRLYGGELDTGVLQVAVRNDGGSARWSRFDLAISPSELGSGVLLELRNTGWVELPGADAPVGGRPRIAVSWRGIGAASEAAEDAEVKRQLEALGYLE